MKTNLNYYVKIILLFCVIDAILQFIIHYIWRYSNTPSVLRGLAIISIPFVVTIIMVRTTKDLGRNKAAGLTVILLVMNCISIIVINVINPFHRIITPSDYRNGFFRETTDHLFVLIPVALVLALIFRRKTSLVESNKDILDDEGYQ